MDMNDLSFPFHFTKQQENGGEEKSNNCNKKKSNILKGWMTISKIKSKF